MSRVYRLVFFLDFAPRMAGMAKRNDKILDSDSKVLESDT